MPLKLTQAAARHLAELLQRSEAPAGAAVRLEIAPAGVAVSLDMPRDSDATFAYDEHTVLIVDTALADMLGSKTLDLQQTADGHALRIE